MKGRIRYSLAGAAIGAAFFPAVWCFGTFAAWAAPFINQIIN